MSRYLSGLQQLVQTDDDQQPEARQEDVHEDPARGARKQQSRGRTETQEVNEENKVERKHPSSRVHVRFSIQAVLSLRDGDRLVEHGVLEDVSLQTETKQVGSTR